MIFGKKKDLTHKLRQTEQDLAKLNVEMAVQLIGLATKTGEVEPLIEAVEALATSQDQFTPSNVTPELAKVQKLLGDTLLKVGKSENDKRAVLYAITAYKGAITLCSMLGLSQLRTAAKRNLSLAENMLGLRKETSSSYFAA